VHHVLIFFLFVTKELILTLLNHIRWIFGMSSRNSSCVCCTPWGLSCSRRI